jgi:Zn-dependent protease
MELDGTPTFILPSAQDTKIPFQKLIEDLKEYDLLALLRRTKRGPQTYQVYTDYRPLEREENELVLKIFPNPEPKKTRPPIINVALLIATICTIAYTGLGQVQVYNCLGIAYGAFAGCIYALYGDPSVLLSAYVGKIWSWYGDPSLLIFIFTASLLAIVGLHEMGHYVTSRLRGQKASLPFFIPGFPPIGTFGALIIQRTPTINRDKLFELGLMGPLTGFIITLIVIILSIYSSPVVYPPVIYYQAVVELQILFNYGPNIYYTLLNLGYPSLFFGNSWPFPFLYHYLIPLLRPVPPLALIPIHPLSWVAWIGMLVTALNLFPIGVLDGGHMARSFLSQRQHAIASIIAAGAMILISDAYILMAILILLMSPRGGHPGALDDVSPIAKWKIAVFAGMIIIAALTIPPLGWGRVF